MIYKILLYLFDQPYLLKKYTYKTVLASIFSWLRLQYTEEEYNQEVTTILVIKSLT